MSEVKRYDFECHQSNSSGEWETYARMKASDSGDYVLYSDYEKLKAQLEKAEETLKFYANEMNYSIDDYHGISGEMIKRCVLYSDCDERNDVYSYAGRRAREYFKEKEQASESFKFKLGTEDTHNAYDSSKKRYTFVCSGMWLIDFRGKRYPDFFRAGDTLTGDIKEAHLIEKCESGYTLTKDGLNEYFKEKEHV